MGVIFLLFGSVVLVWLVKGGSYVIVLVVIGIIC